MRLYSIKHSIAIGLYHSVGEFVAVKVVGIYLLTFQSKLFQELISHSLYMGVSETSEKAHDTVGIKN